MNKSIEEYTKSTRCEHYSNVTSKLTQIKPKAHAMYMYVRSKPQHSMGDHVYSFWYLVSLTQWPVIFSLYRHYAVSIPTLSMKLSGQCTRHSECSDSILRGPRNEIETIFSKMLIMVGL